MEDSEAINQIKYIEKELSLLFGDDFDIIDGKLYLKRERVDEINGLKINIYADHGYPHFHLKANNPEINCKIKISDLSIIDGELPQKYFKKLKEWYNTKIFKTGKTGKEKLEEVWTKYNSNLSF